MTLKIVELTDGDVESVWMSGDCVSIVCVESGGGESSNGGGGCRF